jgi:murein DD-endopeptidase MepM/ murein hydrolase activator NlpD
MKNKISVIIICTLACIIFFGSVNSVRAETDFIKWVDFNVQAETMNKAYELDIKTHKNENHYRFAEILAYLAVKNGNKFNIKKDALNLKKLTDKLESGVTIDGIMENNKYYRYYKEAYNAIFAEYIGWYSEGDNINYGLKVYFPFAKGYWYSGGDDFGNSRNYAFKRVHLGHDMFGAVGTPIIASEGGIVTELGWNRFGGWRIGIRSFDNLRYYYYAHLRKDKPYGKDIVKGGIIEAGQVIGYLGVTGYSYKENKNMKTKPHLHFGIQLIFDKSQEDGKGEIWIDVYQICRFLAKNCAAVRKNNETGHFESYNLRKSVNV